MRYSFQSFREHNFISIIKRKLYQLLWPLVFLAGIQYLFPQSDLVQHKFHLYFFFITEAVALFMILTSDSIKEIVVDAGKGNIEVSYYNIYQGNTTDKYAFSKVKIAVETNIKQEVRHINFYIKRGDDIVLSKDDFNITDLESLKELLYKITSPKSI